MILCVSGDEANKIPTLSPYYLINLSGLILSHYFLMLKLNELIEIFSVKHLIRVSTTHREVSMGKRSLFSFCNSEILQLIQV